MQAKNSASHEAAAAIAVATTTRLDHWQKGQGSTHQNSGARMEKMQARAAILQSWTVVEVMGVKR
jgi:hypothetical protein